MEKIDVIEQAANRLLQHNFAEARIAIETEYPFHKFRVVKLLFYFCNIRIVSRLYLRSYMFRVL